MAEVAEGQGRGAEIAAKWRAPLETAALILLAATVFSVVGGIVNGVFTPDASAWEKLRILGFNVLSLWHVAVLLVAVGLVLAVRIPFASDTRGAATARAALLGSVVLGGIIAICALLGVIGAIGTSGQFTGPTVPEKIGEIMQFLAGGTVAVAATLLALRGQSLVPAPVRAAPPVAAPAAPAAPAAAASASPGWAADPFGRHQWRYWDGTRWTDQVADGSTQSTDPAN